MHGSRPQYHFSAPLPSTSLTRGAAGGTGGIGYRTVSIPPRVPPAPPAQHTAAHAHLSYEPLYARSPAAPFTSYPATAWSGPVPGGPPRAGDEGVGGAGERGLLSAAESHGRTVYGSSGEAAGHGGEQGGKSEPIVSSTLWEDERTVVMQVLVEGHVVARRADNDWVNSTKLLNMANLTRGKRDMYLKNEPQRTVFRRGALHLKGVWLPLPAAAALAKSYDLYDKLFPLFEPNLQQYLFSPVNRERTRQLVLAARGREAIQKPEDDGLGLTPAQKKDLDRRAEALKVHLDELQQGLGMRDGEAGGSEHYDHPQERDLAPQVELQHLNLAGRPTLQLDQHVLAQFHSSGAALPRNSISAYSLGGARSADPHAVAFAAPFPTPSATETDAGSPSHPPHPEGRLPSFDLSLQYLEQLQQQHTQLDSRRPTLDPNFSPDFRAPVSWFDNPTPPERAMGEYISTVDMARRVSVASMATSAGGEELEALLEDQETSVWGAEGVVARSRPPPVGGSGRRGSVPFQRLPCGAAGGEREFASSCPTFHPVQHPVGRSASVPPALDVPLPSTFTPGEPYPIPPPSLHPPPPQPDAGQQQQLDYSDLLAHLSTLSQPSAASQATYSIDQSPLARFQATRLSVDSAAEAVYGAQVGLGHASLVAPHAVPWAETQTRGGSYSWAAAAPVAQEGEEALFPLPPSESGLQEPKSTSFERLSATGTRGVQKQRDGQDDDGYLSNSPTVFHASKTASPAEAAFPPSAHDDPYAFPPPHPRESVQAGTKRVLSELDAAEADSSLLHPSPPPPGRVTISPEAAPAKRSTFAHRTSSFLSASSSAAGSRRGSSAGPLPLPEEHQRLFDPAERRDSLIGVIAGPPQSTKEPAEDEEQERPTACVASPARMAAEDEVLSPRSAKRRRLEGNEGTVSEGEKDVEEEVPQEGEGEGQSPSA
ncbi:hypothetical protein JCM10213v2_008931 [Rhodosporidiobolus nylandii]